MTSIETKNRRLRRAFFSVVFLIVILFIAEVVLVAVMLTRDNGPRKEGSSSFSKVDPSSRDHNNETMIAVGEQHSDRRYQSTANPQDKTTGTKSTDVTSRDIARTEDPENHATTDENYSTDASITDIDDPLIYSTAQNDRDTTFAPPLQTADQTTESESDMIDATLAGDEATTGTTATGQAVEPSSLTSVSAQLNKNVSATISNKTTTDQAMSTEVYETADILYHQTGSTGTPVSTTQILNASFTEAEFGGERGHARVSTGSTPSDSMAQRTSTATYSSARWDSSTMSSISSDTLDISTTEEMDSISTTEEEDLTTTVQADEILQSTTNGQQDSADDADLLTAQGMVIATEEIDFDLLTTTESAHVEKWMDETTAITTSSNARLRIANQPITQPEISSEHIANQPITQLPISSEYTSNESIAIHATTGLSNIQNYSSKQNITESSTSHSTNHLQISTTDDPRLISTKPVGYTIGSSPKTSSSTEEFPQPSPSSTTTTFTAMTTKPEICPLRYDDNCYSLILGDMDYDDARKACRSVNGILADITSRQHYNIMMSYIRHLIPESKQKLDAWTAMTLLITMGKVRLSNFKTATFTRWYPGQPQQDFNRRNIYLHVPKIKSNPQGMVNENLKSKLSGALCVIKKRSSNRG